MTIKAGRRSLAKEEAPGEEVVPRGLFFFEKFFFKKYLF